MSSSGSFSLSALSTCFLAFLLYFYPSPFLPSSSISSSLPFTVYPSLFLSPSLSLFLISLFLSLSISLFSLPLSLSVSIRLYLPISHFSTLSISDLPAQVISFLPIYGKERNVIKSWICRLDELKSRKLDDAVTWIDKTVSDARIDITNEIDKIIHHTSYWTSFYLHLEFNSAYVGTGWEPAIDSICTS